MTGGATEVRADVVEECAERLARRLLAGKIELPALPKVALEVLKLAQSPDVDARRLVALLQQDQGMAANLLKLANSPLYAAREPIVALQQAVARIGFAVVCEQAFALAARSAAFRCPDFAALAEHEWRHATLAACFAREIARTRRRAVESAYLGGLLHDVGRVVVFRELKQVAPSGLATEALAASVADVRHVALGRALVAAWKLPLVFDEAIAFHHELDARPVGSETAPTVALADRMADAAVAASPPEAHVFAAEPAATALGLYPDDLAAVWEKREKIAAAAESCR